MWMLDHVSLQVSELVGVGMDEKVELHCYRVDMLDAPVLSEHDAVQVYI